MGPSCQVSHAITLPVVRHNQDTDQILAKISFNLRRPTSIPLEYRRAKLARPNETQRYRSQSLKRSGMSGSKLLAGPVRRRLRVLSQCVRKQHGKRALNFANRFRDFASKKLERQLNQQIRTTKEAIEKNAEHRDFANSRDGASSCGLEVLLAKNERVLAEVLLIVNMSLAGICGNMQ